MPSPLQARRLLLCLGCLLLCSVRRVGAQLYRVGETIDVLWARSASIEQARVVFLNADATIGIQYADGTFVESISTDSVRTTTGAPIDPYGRAGAGAGAGDAPVEPPPSFPYVVGQTVDVLQHDEMHQAWVTAVHYDPAVDVATGTVDVEFANTMLLNPTLSHVALDLLRPTQGATLPPCPSLYGKPPSVGGGSPPTPPSSPPRSPTSHPPPTSASSSSSSDDDWPTSSLDSDAPPVPHPPTDPYEVLGVDRTACDSRKIRRAFRRMSLKYHPDKTTLPAAEARMWFDAAAEAYEKIGDPDARQVNHGTIPTQCTSSEVVKHSGCVVSYVV